LSFSPTPHQTSHRRKTRLINKMRISTRRATRHHWSRTLHFSHYRPKKCLPNPPVTHCPLLFRLASTIIHHSKTPQVEKMPISLRYSTYVSSSISYLHYRRKQRPRDYLNDFPYSLPLSHHTTSAPSLSPTHLSRLSLFLCAQRQQRI
jgi:hypothetical protein